MNSHPYFIKRPHLVLTIIIAILAFVLLTLAAANHWFRSDPIHDFSTPVIAVPAESNQPTPETK